MPEYYYRCECGHKYTTVRPVSAISPTVICEKCNGEMYHDYEAEQSRVYAPLPFSDGGHIDGTEHQGLTKKKEKELLKRTGDGDVFKEMVEVDHKDPFFHQPGVGLWRKQTW